MGTLTKRQQLFSPYGDVEDLVRVCYLKMTSQAEGLAMRRIVIAGERRELEVNNSKLLASVSPEIFQSIDSPSDDISIPDYELPSKTAQSSNPVVFFKEHWHEYARYVQSHTRIWLRKAGDWQITTKFSNGHRTLKQHMSIILSVLTKDGKYLFRARHEVDLAASGFGSANEYTSDTLGAISSKAASLAHGTAFSASGVTSKILQIAEDQEPWLEVGD